MRIKRRTKRTNAAKAGVHGVQKHAGHGRKSTGETEGQFARDPKHRHGQYGGAGNPPLIMK